MISDGTFKNIITIHSVDDIYKLLEISTSDGEYLCSLFWVGKSLKTGEKIYQPAFATSTSHNLNLSYDGQANFVDSYDIIINPNHGSVYPMQTDKLYYFNNTNPETPNNKYALVYNNKSIRMNNISIFREDFSKGVMLDFRASMEGTFSDESKNGYIVVLAQLDSIN